MKYIVADFHITCDPALLQVARDLLADAIAQVGFESFEDTPDGLKGYVQHTCLSQAMLQQALQEFPLEDVTLTYTLQDVENKNWNEEWEKIGFDPITVNDDIVIYDAHQPRPELISAQYPIFIHARQAFGTGTHQTTRMVLNALSHHALHDKSVLDCGCGTGILGIACSKLGAKTVVCYDIDEWSVENTGYNAAENDVDNLSVLHGDSSVIMPLEQKFDFILANINRNILLNDLPTFASALATDGHIIMSGFYEDDAPMLIRAAAVNGLYETARQTEDHWCCLTFSHKPS